MSASADELFAVAVKQHQAGALRDAEQNYRRALALDSRHVDSLHYLGVLAHQAGRSDAAIELIGRAISLNDRIPECHYNIGVAFGALGRFEDAAKASERAIGLKPDYAEAHLNLGNALKAAGKPEKALAAYRQALSIKPSLAPAHFNLANIFAETDRLEEAVLQYEKAIALRPDYAEAHANFASALIGLDRLKEAEERCQTAIALNPRLPESYANLGNLFLRQRKSAEAIEWYRKALSINPANAEVHNNLGTLLMMRRSAAEAVEHFARAYALKPQLALALQNLAKALVKQGEISQALGLIQQALQAEETAERRSLFAAFLGDLRALPYAHSYRSYLMRALAESWGSSRGLSNVASRLVLQNPIIAEGAAISVQAWPIRLPAYQYFDRDRLGEIAKDDLLLCLLVSERINYAGMEKFLSCLRSVMLETALAGADPEPQVLSLHCALAQQCFLNEYVFSAPDAEWQAAAALRERVGDRLAAGAQIMPAEIAAVATYFPLHSIKGAEARASNEWPAEVDALIRQQVLEPSEEANYRATTPRLTPIDDEISKRVQRQYEENPYPRWSGLPSSSRRSTVKLADYLRAKFPDADRHDFTDGEEYLVAGCGTGRHTAQILSALDVRQMLAVDLSLTSLGYAKRMALKLGLDNVDFAQADILQLPSLGRSFHVIDSSGVLHHLADPFAGWKALLTVLKPGGFMRLGLYSKLARNAIVLARELIAERGHGHSPEEIRRFRQEIFAIEPGIFTNQEEPLLKLLQLGDFYSLSECRDLLFHVQEHRLTLPQIGKFLDENNLAFLGFELDAETFERYGDRLPEDQAATNLESWHRFELDNPDTFIAMYQFWIQKRPANKDRKN